MASRKDFALVAGVINQTREFAENTLDLPDHSTARAILYVAAKNFVREFEKDNPLFDSERFLRVCGFEGDN